MAVAPGSALGYLRTRSLVDCDTLDAKGTLNHTLIHVLQSQRRSDIDANNSSTGIRALSRLHI